MPVTFNTNNNYDVEIVTEPDVLNPTVIKYSSDTNTPFVEVKITPRLMQYPLLAGNMNFNSLPRFIKHEPSLNVNFSCTPASSPHGINSSLPYEEIITSGNVYLIGTSCSSAGTNMVTTSSQGPFESERNGAPIYGDLVANGVAWTKVVWIEVYEADDGTMINDQVSPEALEDLQLWNTWGTYPLITNNVNPQYIRAFVFLEYGPNGPAGLSSNVNIQIDIDENLPVYGCTDPTASNYDASGTIDDGSCTYSITNYSIAVQNTYLNTSPIGAYIDPPHLTQVPCFPNNFTYIFQGYVNTINLTGSQPTHNHSSMPSNARLLHALLANTYAPGDFVSELVQVTINPQYGNFQVSPGHNTQGLAIYPYPGEVSPATAILTSSTPADASTWMGDTLNNLTAASVQIDNLSSTDSDGNTVTPRPTYLGHNVVHGLSSNTSVSAPWLPDPGSGWVDEDGNYPTTIVEWGDSSNGEGPIIHSLQADGSIFDIQTLGCWAEEIHSTDANLNAQFPASLYFPRKVELYIQLSFTMPSNDVLINLDLRHNNEYLNWI